MAALARRSVATAFSGRLTGALRPALPHLLLTRDDDGDRQSIPPPPPPPAPPRISQPFASAPLFYPRLPLGLAGAGSMIGTGVRNYTSTAAESSAKIAQLGEVFNDPATPLPDIPPGPVTPPLPYPGEVAAAAADSFAPVAALQHLIDLVHTISGLNWWACIVLTTLLVRGATLPVLLSQVKSSAKLTALKPEMEKLQAEIQYCSDMESAMEGRRRMNALFKKHGVSPFTPLIGILVQGPIFMSFFFAIRNMVEKVPSFKGGGALWFTDLTVNDSLYIFPVLTGLAFLITVELNAQEGFEGNPMAGTMKNVFRVVGVATIPVTASLPTALFCYWITSNLFSLFYGLAFKQPAVRKFFDLPDIPPPPPPSQHPNTQVSSIFSFMNKQKAVPPAPASSSPVDEQKAAPSAAMNNRVRNLEKIVKAKIKSRKRRN